MNWWPYGRRMCIFKRGKGIKLTADEINALKEGKPVYVDGMTSKNGKPFDATLQYSAERRGLEFIYPESQGFNQQSLGGVQLSPSQIKMLSEGHTILVEDMKRTDGALFSSFVTLDKVTGRPQYTRHNPENGEIYIPKEICNVQLTPEDKEALRKGQPVFLENMINRKGGGVLLLRQTGHEYWQAPILPHTGRIQRTPGTDCSGRSIRACVHRTGAGQPAGRKSHTRIGPEKREQQDIQFLSESERKFRTAAILSGEPGHTP